MLQPYTTISAAAKRSGKLSVIRGTNKPFENSQPNFIDDSRHGISVCHSTIVTKSRGILYLKKDIVRGNFVCTLVLPTQMLCQFPGAHP